MERTRPGYAPVMTTPHDDEVLTSAVGEPGSPHDHEAAEAYAESVGIDPTSDEVDRYLRIAGDKPLSEPAPDSEPEAGDDF